MAVKPRTKMGISTNVTTKQAPSICDVGESGAGGLEDCTSGCWMVSDAFRFGRLHKVTVGDSQACNLGKVASENTKGTCNIVIISTPQVQQGGELVLKAVDQGNKHKGVCIH